MGFLDRLILKWTERSREYQEAVEAIKFVRSLPLERVKEGALGLLSNSEVFRTSTVIVTKSALIEDLGPNLREFFSKYESVERVFVEFAVARQEVRASFIRPGFLRIGTDFGDAEIVVRRGEDEVFSVNSAADPLDGYATIYHKIYLIGVNWGYIPFNPVP